MGGTTVLGPAGFWGPQGWEPLVPAIAPTELESLMADINTTLETLSARIDQLVADLQATNPTPAPAPPARTRWTFETEQYEPGGGERVVATGRLGDPNIYFTEDAPHIIADVIVPGSIRRLDP